MRREKQGPSREVVERAKGSARPNANGRVSGFQWNRARRVAPGEQRIKSAFAGLMDRRQLNQISITTGGAQPLHIICALIRAPLGPCLRDALASHRDGFARESVGPRVDRRPGVSSPGYIDVSFPPLSFAFSHSLPPSLLHSRQYIELILVYSILGVRQRACIILRGSSPPLRILDFSAHARATDSLSSAGNAA